MKRYVLIDDGPSFGQIVLCGLALLALVTKVAAALFAVVAVVAIIRSLIAGTFFVAAGRWIAACLLYGIVFAAWR